MRVALLCLWLALLAGPAQADATGIPAALAKARAHTDRLVTSGAAPSLAVAVYRDGGIIAEWGSGWADRAQAVEAGPDTIYPVASVSKSITAAAVMRLVEQGKLTLDDRFNRLMADRPIQSAVFDADRITVRHLLAMNGGLPHLVLHRWTDEPQTISDRDLLARSSFVAFEPGSTFHYSNLSFALLLQLVERTSGMPFEAYAHQELFAPLGLSHSFLRIPARAAGDAAKLYADSSPEALAYDRLVPDGGAWFLTSAHDLATFGGALTRPGLILKPQSIERMWRIDPSSHYGLGWWEAPGRPDAVVADGQAMGATARLMVLPSRRLAIAVLSNQAISTSDLSSVFEEVLAGLDVPSVNSAPPPTAGTLHQARPVGAWSGSIASSTGSIPFGIRFPESGLLVSSVGGKEVEASEVRNQAGLLRIALADPTLGMGIAGKDYGVQLFLRCSANRFTGYAQAQSRGRPHFVLPYFVSLQPTDAESRCDEG